AGCPRYWPARPSMRYRSGAGQFRQGGRSGGCAMDARELKAACLALPGAVEDFPFGEEVSVFKVAGKMFALCDLDGDPLRLSIKCDPEFAAQLQATYPAIEAGQPLSKRH